MKEIVPERESGDPQVDYHGVLHSSEMEFPFYDPSLQWPQQYWPTAIPAGTSDPTNLNYPVFDAFWTETAPPYQDPKIPNIAAPITIRDAGHNLPDTASAATSQQSESQPRVGRRKKDTPVNKTPRRLLKEANRYNELLYDEYVLSFTPTEVTCGGCGSTIQLEKRGGAQYYVGMWKRHKAACKGIKAGITAARRREAESGFTEMELQPIVQREEFPPMFLHQQF